MSLVSVVYCQVKASASDLSLVQGNSSEFGVLSVIMKPTRGCRAREVECAFVGYCYYL